LRHGGFRSSKEMVIQEIQKLYLGLETSCLYCVCGFVQSPYVTYRVNIVQTSLSMNCPYCRLYTIDTTTSSVVKQTQIHRNIWGLGDVIFTQYLSDLRYEIFVTGFRYQDLKLYTRTKSTSSSRIPEFAWNDLSQARNNLDDAVSPLLIAQHGRYKNVMRTAFIVFGRIGGQTSSDVAAYVTFFSKDGNSKTFPCAR